MKLIRIDNRPAPERKFPILEGCSPKELDFLYELMFGYCYICGKPAVVYDHDKCKARKE